MSVLTESWVLAGRVVQRFARVPAAMVTTLIFPVLLLLVMLLSFGGLVDKAEPGGYVMRLTPLIILSAASSGAVVTATGFNRDLKGLVGRLIGMPMSRWSMLTGWVGGSVARTLLTTGAILAVATVVGFRFREGVLGFAGFVGVVVAFSSAVTWLALYVAMSVSSEEAARSILGPPITLLVFLSSGFVAADEFVGPLRPIVQLNPFSSTVETLMGLSGGGEVTRPLLQSMAWCLGVGAVCALAAVHRYQTVLRPGDA